MFVCTTRFRSVIQKWRNIQAKLRHVWSAPIPLTNFTFLPFLCLASLTAAIVGARVQRSVVWSNIKRTPIQTIFPLQGQQTLRQFFMTSSLVCYSICSWKWPLLIRVAKPCSADGKFLSKEAAMHPPPRPPMGRETGNEYAPFEDRLAFNWAHHHYVELQSSEKKIGKGLDLWLAAVKSQSLDGTIP